MHVLGIAGYNHDAAAALMRDGELVAAAEEERFTRIKHQDGFPYRAIQYCLKEAEVQESSVDYVVYANNLWGNFGKMLAYAKSFHEAPVYTTGFALRDLYTRMWITFLMRMLSNTGGGGPRLRFVDHHLAHMGSSFFVSPFESAAVLSIDSLGDGDTTVLGHGEGQRLKKLSRVNYPHSIAEMYCCVTNYLGFPTQDEYKVMGLASYGEARYLERLRRLVRFLDKGRYRIDTRYFQTHRRPGRFLGYVSRRFIDEFGPMRREDARIEQRHKDMAASLQKLFEETVFHCLRALHRMTGEKRLCLCGGAAQNSVMNGKILLETPFQEIYVPPAPGDSGGSIGAASYFSYGVLQQRRGFVMRTADWGPSFSETQIKAVLDESKSRYSRSEDVAADAAALLAKGYIVGWYQGRMEFGPRALGARSILADPTRPNMTDIVNRDVKHREDFRPFAPSVLREYVDEYFFGHHEAPFMSYVWGVRPDKAAAIPAVVHIDKTARVQTVERDDNALYWEVIKRFEKLKGVPVVLNTSFNVKGEPIVCTPRDAVRCFFSTGLDCLVIGPFVLKKEVLRATG